MRQRKAEEWSKWRGLVSEQLQSGQGVAAFCRGRGLREWRFYAWKKRLRGSEAREFVEVGVAAPQRQIQPMGAGGDRGAVAGRRIAPGFDADHLLAVLETEA
ncbi:MAG: IS66 family insertion sequence element accessory protein TnpA [Acidobacteriaceae bacterium]